MRPGIPLHDVDQVRAVDRAAVGGTPDGAFELMARAGAASLALLRRRWPEARRLLVACGSGNNGGDGYVLARLARESGLEVGVVVPAEAAPRSPEAQRAAAEWSASGGGVEVYDGELAGADLLVDALLGIGLAAAPREPLAGLLRALAASAAPVLALDVPSGVDADSGDVPGDAVRANATVSFIAAKRGLYTGAGREHAGSVEVAVLGIAPALLAQAAPAARLLRPAALSGFLPPRRANAHKGLYGHVLVVGGDHGMGGAARLAAEAAARCGAGLVSVATRSMHVGALLAARPELMVHATGEDGVPDATLLRRASVLAVGPGLGRGDWGRALLRHCLASGKPLVLDADALNLLAEDAVQLPVDSIVTPHPGEAARLLQCDTGAVQRDRFAAAAALVEQLRCVVVLKGAGSIVAAPGCTPVVIDAGNPGMASGGMGDVLTGTVAALRAQGLGAFDAACCGALLHAAAGDLAARAGERGLLAGDLLPALQRLCNPEPR